MGNNLESFVCSNLASKHHRSYRYVVLKSFLTEHLRLEFARDQFQIPQTSNLPLEPQLRWNRTRQKDQVLLLFRQSYRMPLCIALGVLRESAKNEAIRQFCRC